MPGRGPRGAGAGEGVRRRQGAPGAVLSPARTRGASPAGRPSGWSPPPAKLPVFVACDDDERRRVGHGPRRDRAVAPRRRASTPRSSDSIADLRAPRHRPRRRRPRRPAPRRSALVGVADRGHDHARARSRTATAPTCIALPTARRLRVRLRAGLVPPPPRARRSPPGVAVRGASRSAALARHRHPRRPRAPAGAGSAPPMAANEPGQPDPAPPLISRDLPTAGVGARHRRPSRRRRVRLRGHAGQVGGRRLRRAPPRPHRRLEGHVGPGRRHRRARPPPASASSARPRAGSPATHAGTVVFLGQVDGELDSGARAARRGGAGDPRAPPAGGARPRPVEALPAAPRSSPRRAARVRWHRRCPRPALLQGARPRSHRPTTLLLWEADEPDHVEDVTGVRRRQAARARGAREPVREHDEGRRPGADGGVPRSHPPPARRPRLPLRRQSPRATGSPTARGSSTLGVRCRPLTPNAWAVGGRQVTTRDPVAPSGGRSRRRRGPTTAATDHQQDERRAPAPAASRVDQRCGSLGDAARPVRRRRCR